MMLAFPARVPNNGGGELRPAASKTAGAFVIPGGDPVSILKVTDETTRSELAECLAHLCAHARRQQCIVGDSKGATAWDVSHERINAVLSDWLAAAE